MLESRFQSEIRDEVKALFPEAIIFKTDANQIQGFPDILILYKKKWAVLECKRSSREKFRPNQEYYIDLCNSMSFARVIYPENKEEVLYELQLAFEPRRSTRIPRRI